ncbi:MAG: MBL fold metallo-hydrolase [Acidobacteria bacterium]|nr:MBL fold metallo-hydrolase [Acidobacteriota bacterium]
MKRTSWLVVACAALLVAAGAAAEDVAGLPLHVQKLDPTAVRVWIGDHISSTATVAIATGKGIVVVDTLGNPRIDAQLRKVIARELGRSDFAMLIITHEHGDHTGGNAVYADCPIVGHELVAAGMAAQGGDREEVLAWHDRRVGEIKAELAKEPAGSPKAARMKEELALDRVGREALTSDAKKVPPTKTFADRLTLDMGDTTFELTYIGGMHSASDIAVLVPEHGLLLTGDTMADRWLTDTPGCLASFMARGGVQHDFPLWLDNWGRLLARKDQIKRLVPGHWNGELSIQGAEARVSYVRTLWDGISEAVAAGKSMDEVMVAYRLETRFPELAKSPGFSERNNFMTVSELWSVITKQESAAGKLYELIAQGAGEEAIRQVVAERGAKQPKYYFLEVELNAQAYRFLQEEKVKEATALFRVNVELFPASWNVYDSLGEALLKAGDVPGAVGMYEKSVELNPNNQNGKDALARIRTAPHATT